MTWLNGSWSDPHLIADRDHAPWFKACEDRPGVYRLIGLADAGVLTPAKISRVCGVDEQGILYIGAAKSLRSLGSARASAPSAIQGRQSHGHAR